MDRKAVTAAVVNYGMDAGLVAGIADIAYDYVNEDGYDIDTAIDLAITDYFA